MNWGVKLNSQFAPGPRITSISVDLIYLILALYCTNLWTGSKWLNCPAEASPNHSQAATIEMKPVSLGRGSPLDLSLLALLALVFEDRFFQFLYRLKSEHEMLAMWPWSVASGSISVLDVSPGNKEARDQPSASVDTWGMIHCSLSPSAGDSSRTGSGSSKTGLGSGSSRTGSSSGSSKTGSGPGSSGIGLGSSGDGSRRGDSSEMMPLSVFANYAQKN